MRGGVAGEAEILLALTEDLMHHGDRQPGDAEAAEGEIIAVGHQPGHGLGDGGELIGEGRGLEAK